MVKTQTLKSGAAYIRVSTDKQEELSPDAQRRLIIEYAKKNGILLSDKDIFIENGISGKKADKRPMFKQMIAIAKSKEHPYDVILVWKFSRFARNQDESILYKSLLRKKNVDVVSISEPIIDGPFGSLIERIIEWMDEYYSINLSSEVKRGMTEKALRGGYQATTPLGYDHHADGVPTINLQEAQIVRQIFQEYINGADFSTIARNLNDAGFRTRRGNPFELRVVRYILRNPFYIGKIRWNRAKHGAYTENDPEDIIIVDGQHTPIISEEAFNTANDRINREFRPVRRKGTCYTKHWLCGVLKCGYCGANLIYVNNKRNKCGTGNFQCYKYAKGLHKKSCSVSQKIAEESVMEALERILSTGYVDFKYSAPLTDSSNSKLPFLKKELESLVKKEQRIKAAYIDGIDTLDEYKANKNRIADERKQITKKIHELSVPTNVDTTALQQQMLLRCRNIYDILKSAADNEKKAAAIRSICESITFDRDTCTFKYVFYLS